MRVNWRKFGFLFLFLQFAFFAGGCTAAWIGTLSAMIPGISGLVSAIVSFVMALENKTVPSSFSSSVQKWASNASSLLSQLQTLVASAASSATSTVISEIQAVMAQLSQSLGTILTDTGITDENTQNKVEELFALFSGAVNTVLALIPVALARIKAGASTAQLEAADTEAKDSISNAHKALKTAYHSIVTQETPSMDVNAALAAMPSQLP